MKLYLIIVNGKHKGTPIPIDVDLFLIGQSSSCQLRSKVEGVGKQHCAIVNRNEKVFVRDLGCGEPTLLNDELLPPQHEWPLHTGDHLQVGPFEFLVQFHERSLARRDLEEWALKCLDKTEDRELCEDEDEREAHCASQAAAGIINRLQMQRGEIVGRLRIGRIGTVTTVRFSDSQLIEESEISMMRTELCTRLTARNQRVLLDCKNIARMSTGAVQMLDQVYKWLRSRGTSMVLCRVRSDLQVMLRTMSSIPLYQDKTEALVSRW